MKSIIYLLLKPDINADLSQFFVTMQLNYLKLTIRNKNKKKINKNTKLHLI